MLLLTAQNELPLFFIKDMNQSKPIYIASIPNRCTQHQPKNNLHSINPITVHTASDFLLVGFLSPKTYTLPSTPYHTVILRGAEGEVAESIIQKITLASGRGGTVADDGRGPGETTFPHPSSAHGHLFPREKMIFQLPFKINC